jgi:glycosyltransferase involved in cell wall biosynthesis
MIDDGQPHLVFSEHSYNFVSFQARIFALPQSLGPIDLAAEDVGQKAGVFIGTDLQALRKIVFFENALRNGIRLVPMTSTPANTAFYGSNHPAYATIFDGSYKGFVVQTAPTSHVCTSETLQALDVTLASYRARTSRIGVPEALAGEYLSSRDYLSLLIQESHPGVHWLQGAPLSVGSYPWIIQVENPTSLWLPFFSPASSSFLTKQHDIFKLVRNELLSDSCLAIVSNLRGTIAALPKLFESPSLSEKIYYLPFVTGQPPKMPKKRGTFLFTTSWHQHREGFFDRGGVDTLMIFQKLSQTYKHLQLTMRCDPPDDLPAELKKILSQPNVKVIKNKVSKRKMEALFEASEFYMLPSASLHSMSTLEAMSHGCVCVLADAWGSDEYLKDGSNGVRLTGREGRDWSYDEESGLITEQHHAMEVSDPDFVLQGTERLSQLLTNADERQRISEAARAYAAKHHSLIEGRERFAQIMESVYARMEGLRSS